ncbi:Chloramphenicol acetyltransferase-like domain-containing protein [Artemisia annua]|uniref:Chloramphenicol acetyltransferase-like domain-containing protein n=1 Tax=Artemisia annua TaxID=35608 RepID=A0A2U1M2R5_ARTAN|nr:Chloramphenicol acetyltransferase-like domain-containing protein [Artemisia annua]
MTISLSSYIHTPIPLASSMKLHRVKAITAAMNIEIHSRKLIKPLVSTPLNRRCYKISIIDEFAPNMNLPLVLFFPPNSKYNLMFVKKLEESLEKALTFLYPLAGRYMEHLRTVDCNDQGIDFIQAQADITVQEILDPKIDPMLINNFVPSKSRVLNHTDAILATQITMLKCGGLALGVSISHRIGDASTVINFLNQWATLSQRDTNVETGGIDFTLFSLSPAQGLPCVEAGFSNLVNDDDYVTKKLSFNESAISNMKENVKLTGKRSTHRLSKVQLVSALIWKAFLGIDHAIYGQPRDSVLVQPVALRQKKEKWYP